MRLRIQGRREDGKTGRRKDRKAERLRDWKAERLEGVSGGRR